MTPTPLEILSLAQLRREDPETALRLATEAGKQSDKSKGWIEQPKETK
jgi:hypothetical protein